MLIAATLTQVMTQPAQAAPLETANRQLILVLSDDWAASTAHLKFYSRGEDAIWKGHNSRPWRTRIGRNGLAWGGAPGISECPQAGIPNKQEGDGKGPAGVFPLLSSFGFPQEKNHKQQLPFTSLTSSWEGVDDPKSAYYNQVLDTRQVATRDWNSCEKMLIPEYQLGLRVGYNTDPPVPGRGSCIFMHIFSIPEKATSGCTAMSLAQMRTLCDWLKPEDKPVLAQLPRSLYEQVRESWGLP